MNIGQAIRTIRKNENLSQGNLAMSIGVTQGYLSIIENGKKKPSLDVLERVAEEMMIPLPVLFWFAVDRDDVTEGKRYIYDTLKPSIDKLITEVFSQE